MIQINLVPDVKIELIRTQRHRRIVISSAVLVLLAAAAVTILLATYVFVYQNYMKKSNTDKITNLDIEFREIPDIAKTVTLSNQLSSINLTHDDAHKAMVSRLFDVLTVAASKGTDNSASITSISFDTVQRTVSVSAQTDLRGFDAADVFQKNIESMTVNYVTADDKGAIPEATKDNVSSFVVAQNVSMTDLTSGRDDKDKRQKVSFKLSFSYDPLLFSPNIGIVSMQGLGDGNVTDSYTRLPQSLFSSAVEEAK